MTDTTDDVDWFYGEDEWNEYRVTCKYCGETGLRWDKTEEGRWRVMELTINLSEVALEFIIFINVFEQENRLEHVVL